MVKMITNGLSNIYYILWADAILSFKKHNPKKDWKWPLFSLITWIQALNLGVILIWLKFFKIINISMIEINFLPGTILDKVLASIIQLAMPFAILNYFLIYHKNRYEVILEKYLNKENKKYILIYSFSVLFIFLFTIFFYGYLTDQMHW